MEPPATEVSRMKQTTISNVNAGFELLVEELGYAVDEIPHSSNGARRAVS